MKLFYSICLICIPLFIFSQKNQSLKDFENETDQFLSKYVMDGYVDYNTIKEDDEDLVRLISMIEEISFEKFIDVEKQAFFINVYNLLVINQIVKNYPTASVMDIPGFFDRTKNRVGGESLTLNKIEKEILLDDFKDSRFHFALICGAKDCPKIWNHAIIASALDKQLNERTRAALNDYEFLKNTEKGYGLSEIFKWNIYEFGGKNEVLNFINSFRDEPIDPNANTFYYEYDWTLNDVIFANDLNGQVGNNSFRYVTSASVPKGGVEVKIFNNLYSQIEGQGNTFDKRSSYFTSSLSFLYGTSNRFNLGFVSRYRRVLNNNLPSSAFDVLGSVVGESGRQRITAFGPQIRWAPFKNLSNFSIQSSLTFPIGKQLSGGSLGPFLDWAGPVFFTQFFNDKSIGDKFSLFTEIDLLIEEIGGSGKSNRVSTPITIILSWFPMKNFTIYGLAGYSPYYANPYDYFIQLGFGVKYQLTPNFEIEILATDFSNRYLNSIEGSAATYNLGFRYSR